MRHIFLAGLLLAAVVGSSPGAPPASDLALRQKTFQELLKEHWEYTLSHNPEFASILGDKRWNDKVSDFSQKAIDEELQKTREFLTRFEAVDTKGFPEQEALTKTLLVRDFRLELENARFKGWEMPVSQISGIHLQAPGLVPLLPFTTVKDYEDYVARMKQLPRLFDDTIVQMRKGMADGLMPPRFLLEKVVVQAEGIARQKPEETPFAEPLSKFPKEISEADQKRLREEFLGAIRDSVLPAYGRFAKFVEVEYAPRGRTEPGMWALPDGAARYAAAVKRSTTTELTPGRFTRSAFAKSPGSRKRCSRSPRGWGSRT